MAKERELRETENNYSTDDYDIFTDSHSMEGILRECKGMKMNKENQELHVVKETEEYRDNDQYELPNLEEPDFQDQNMEFDTM